MTLETLFSLVRQHTWQNQAAVEGLLTRCHRNVQERTELVGEIGTQERQFNFFKAIAAQYRKENLHSDILELFLNPATPEIGDKRYLRVFLEQLGLHTKFRLDGPIVVKREEGKIDLLVHNGRQAVILENKINNAPDMPNQLCRYYHYVREQLHIPEILMMVYLPLDKAKTPPIAEYRYQDYSFCSSCGKCKVPQVLLENKAVLKDLTRVLNVEELVQILTKWADVTDRQDVAFFIKHYANLITELGENVMTEQIDKTLVRDMFASQENITTAQTIASLWEQRERLLRLILADDLSNALAKRGYVRQEDTVNEDKTAIFALNLPANKAFSRIVFKPEWLTFALEVTAPEYEPSAREKLGNPACSAYPYTTDVNDSFHRQKWIFRNFQFKTSAEPLPQILKKCVQCFANLEELVK